MGWEVTTTTTLAVIGGQVSIVQVAAGTSSAAFASNITPGNSVIVGVTSSGSPSVSPASGPDSFGLDGSGDDCFWFHVSGSAGGYTTVNLSGGSALFTMEAYGSVTFDSAVESTGTSEAWSSGSYTPSSASEVLLALFSGSFAPTVTSSGWTEYAQQGSVSAAGYQLTTSTAAKTYSGTLTVSSKWYAGIAGYVIPSAVPSTPASGCVLYYTNGQLWALGQSGVPVVLATT
jgi:hypothetical protein